MTGLSSIVGRVNEAPSRAMGGRARVRVMATLVAAVLCFFAMPITVPAAIYLFKEDFETEPHVPNVTQSTLLQWNILRGNVDVFQGGPGNVCPSTCVDLDGDSGVAMETKASFLLQPGKTYELGFDLAGSGYPNSYYPANVVTVSLGGAYTEVFVRAGEDPFVTVRRIIQVSSPVTVKIAFDQAGRDFVGATLDNVTFREVILPPLPRDAAECQQRIGLVTRDVVSQVLLAHTQCLDAEAGGKRCDVKGRDVMISRAVTGARQVLDRICSLVEYHALGLPGTSDDIRDGVIERAKASAVSVIADAYVADYANGPSTP